MLSNFGATKFDSRATWASRTVKAAVRSGLMLLRTTLPQTCTLCAARSGESLICGECMREIPCSTNACPQCALPSSTGETCGACLAAPPPYAATVAAWQYAFPADRLLQSLKYGGLLALAEPLGDVLADAVSRRAASLPDRLLALPLSVARQRARGFNHAQEIARRVSSRTGVPLGAGLYRVRDSPPQAGLALAARARNVRGAFRAVAQFDGLAIAIVDDVMTTGATLAAAALAARRAGAKRVEAWVVARTLQHWQRN
jgi:ComF family protein